MKPVFKYKANNIALVKLSRFSKKIIFGDSFNDVFSFDILDTLKLSKAEARSFVQAVDKLMNWARKPKHKGGKVKVEYNDGFYNFWVGGRIAVKKKRRKFYLPGFIGNAAELRRIAKALGTAIKHKPTKNKNGR